MESTLKRSTDIAKARGEVHAALRTLDEERAMNDGPETVAATRPGETR